MKAKHEANRDDVLDELKFIKNPANNYKLSQRDTAMRLHMALNDCEFTPAEQIQNVIDILDGHNVTMPRGLKRLDGKLNHPILMDNGGSMRNMK